VAIVRLSGPQAYAIACKLSNRSSLPARTPVRSWLTAEDGSVIDDGLLFYFPAPRSFTGEEVVEIHGHGGPVVVEMLLERVLELGARLARPGEFSERAFLNGKIDLTQAEAIADLIDASSRSAARAAVQGLSGRFARVVDELDRQLTRLRVYVEAAIDFVDEPIDFLAEGEVAAGINQLRETIAHWLAVGEQGLLLRHGVRVAIVGAPNVGKSSLLNALLGEERAIVTDLPGTTRDIVRESIVVDGLTLHLLDTAGIRLANDPVEQIGVARTHQAIEQADLILWLRAPDVEDDRVAAVIDGAKEAGKWVVEVWNKADRFPPPAGDERFWIAAQTNQGVPELLSRLRQVVGFRGVDDEVWLARQRHLDALRRADQLLMEASEQLGQWELLAEALRLAHDALGEITGKVDADRLLGVIFSQFCIGK
jgi:tRNA modification GTPase